jgi:hypothetical protein
MVVWNHGKLQSQKKEGLCLMSWTVPHYAQILCFNFIKYYSSRLHVHLNYPIPIGRLLHYTKIQWAQSPWPCTN